MRPVGESEFVRPVAERSRTLDGAGNAARIGGIVGFADLTLGDSVAAVLEAHIEAAGELFRGIRHASGWDASVEIRNSHTDPSEHLLAEAAFKRGFAQLERYDLSFDAWLYHPQIAQLETLAAEFDSTTIVLDHVGGPLGIGPYAGRTSEVFELWKPAIAALSERENVVVKLGGLAMPVKRLRLAQAPRAARLRGVGRRAGALLRTCDRVLWSRALHVRKQFPGR